MTITNTPGSSPETSLEQAIEARVESLDAGNYRVNTELILKGFKEFLQEQRNVDHLEELTVLDCRRYAQWLRKRVRNDDDPLSAASAHANGPYFTVVRAFLSWCVDDERIEANPARPNRVKDVLPEFHGTHDRQYWSPETREEFVDYVDRRAKQSIDEVSTKRHRAFRDRALVMMLALTGARGAELFNDPRDHERNGLKWGDVDLENGIATVLGKKREQEHIPLANRVSDALRRYKRVFEPPTFDWPVFPTGHRPTLTQQAKEELRSSGWSTEAIDEALASRDTLEVMRAENLCPPAISKNGARSLLKQLSADADLEIDGEYLKPHGGRRGFGSEVYADDPELAQELLRHVSIETTHESYREHQVKEQRERLEEILESD